jgi:two-component system, response regulator, stage 0 sporulation protein F
LKLREEETEGSVTGMEGNTILIVDDEPNLLRAMNVRLKAAGYKVIAAMDGMQAVMMTHKHNPDLVILDIRMPGGSGLTVLEKLKASLKTRRIPVIVASAFSDEDIMDKARLLGAAKFFRKPFEIDDLLKAIEEALPAKASA